MDYSVLLPVLIAVLSPVFFLAGILFVTVTAKIAVAAVALSALTVTLGGLDFSTLFSESYHPIFRFSSLYFLMLALVANTRWGRKLLTFRKAKTKIRGVRIESQNAWVLSKRPNEKVRFAMPKTIAASHRDYAESDLKFRITGDSTPPIEGNFGLTSKRQILLPERILNELRKSRTVRFVILE